MMGHKLFITLMVFTLLSSPGFAAPKASAPKNWLVNIENIYTGDYLCSGALVSKYWVLTTARCVQNNGSSRLSVLLQPLKASDRSVKVWAHMDSLTFDNEDKLAMFKLEQPVTDRKPVKLSYRDNKTRLCKTLLCTYLERITPNPPLKFQLEEYARNMTLISGGHDQGQAHGMDFPEVFCTVASNGKSFGNRVVMGSALTDCRGQLVGLGIRVDDVPSLQDKPEPDTTYSFNAFLKLSAFERFIESKLPPEQSSKQARLTSPGTGSDSTEISL